MLAVAATVTAGCQKAPPPGTSHSPSGYVDSVTLLTPIPYNLTSGTFALVRVKGWAWDWDSDYPVQVAYAIRKDGRTEWVGPYWNDDPRPDVQAAFGRGAKSGFDVRVDILSPGRATICAVALNTIGPGENSVLGCGTVLVPAVS